MISTVMKYTFIFLHKTVPLPVMERLKILLLIYVQITLLLDFLVFYIFWCYFIAVTSTSTGRLFWTWRSLTKCTQGTRYLKVYKNKHYFNIAKLLFSSLSLLWKTLIFLFHRTKSVINLFFTVRGKHYLAIFVY